MFYRQNIAEWDWIKKHKLCAIIRFEYITMDKGVKDRADDEKMPWENIDGFERIEAQCNSIHSNLHQLIWLLHLDIVRQW